MEFEDILNALNLALDELYNKQQTLFDDDTNEVTINGYLSTYLRKYFKGYDVDPEYNREHIPLLGITRTKRTITPRGEEDIIKADIIIHRRNKTTANLVVIECKKQWNHDPDGRKKDLQVLGGMTMSVKQAQDLEYHDLVFLYPYGLYIDYGKTRKKVIISRIKNGTSELQEIKIHKKIK